MDHENRQRVHFALERWLAAGELLVDFAHKSAGAEHRKPLARLKDAVGAAGQAIQQLEETRKRRG